MIVTVLKQHSYRQRQRMPGDSYEASDRDVPVLRLMKLVEPQPDKPIPPPKRQQDNPAPRPKPQQDRPAPRRKKAKSRKRRYKRRDMKAGD